MNKRREERRRSDHQSPPRVRTPPPPRALPPQSSDRTQPALPPSPRETLESPDDQLSPGGERQHGALAPTRRMMGRGTNTSTGAPPGPATPLLLTQPKRQATPSRRQPPPTAPLAPSRGTRRGFEENRRRRGSNGGISRLPERVTRAPERPARTPPQEKRLLDHAKRSPRDRARPPSPAGGTQQETRPKTDTSDPPATHLGVLRHLRDGVDARHAQGSQAQEPRRQQRHRPDSGHREEGHRGDRVRLVGPDYLESPGHGSSTAGGGVS